MSAIKLKNDIVRKLNAAVAAGTLPKGVTFEAQLKDRRIFVRIMSAPFDALKPERIKIDNLGMSYSYSLSLMSGPEKDHTPEGCKLLANAEAIVKEICPQGARVWFGSECYNAQGRRMRLATLATPAAAPALAVAI